jgi:hypothetical protein
MATSRLLVAALAAIAASAVGPISSSAGTTAPPSFELVFDAHREPADFSPIGSVPVGSFTASGSFCPSGRATTIDVRAEATIQLVRLLTCADGSGSATAIVSFASGSFEDSTTGAWRIVSGTGQYTNLRGRGTFSAVRTGGDPNDLESITFRSTWKGVADHDNAPPAIAFSRTSVTKLRRPAASYVLRVAFSAEDAPGSPVLYRATVTARGAFLGSKVGETASGKASAAIRLRAPKGVRRLRIEIAASDALGNESKVSRGVALPK